MTCPNCKSEMKREPNEPTFGVITARASGSSRRAATFAGLWRNARTSAGTNPRGMLPHPTQPGVLVFCDHQSPSRERQL